MAYPKINPDEKTEVLSVRVSRSDFERLRDLARAEDRPTCAQARHLIREGLSEALNLSSSRAVPDEDQS